MRFTSAFFAKVALAAMFGSGALAAPWAPDAKHTTHSVRELLTGVKLESYHPESNFQTFGTEGLDHPLRKRAEATTEDKVKSFLADHLKVDADTIQVRTGFKSDVAEHSYVKQMHNGVAFSNAVANVAFGADGRITSFATSFVKPTKIAASTPTLTKEQAIAAAEKAIGASYNGFETHLEYVVKADHSAALTHAVQIQNDAAGVWVEAHIDAHTGELVSMTDFVAKATYRVLPIQKEVLTQGFETLVNPEDSTSSPYGWLKTTSSGTASTSTQGNNAIAYAGSTTGTAPQSSSGSFVYTQNPAQAPTVSANKNAAIVNAFYVVNSVHDITYKYGFTEAAYNFQNTQIASGGKGNDRVKISVQDNGGTDNANFATPPDGQSGQMRMYLWDETSPERDGALENDIITHENTHGISNRMTGGGTGACLQSTEAGGMGEGWSDTMAFWMEQTSATVSDYVMGQYVIADSAGIRSHPYSTSKTVNPYTYATIATKNEVHDIGEIWANTLVNVYAALVAAKGFDAGAKTSSTGTGGNTIFLHLMLDGFALQPCTPTFLTARNAIIQADANRYAGANKCTLWKAFASRGLGVNAANHVDNTAVPSGC